ncbi:hypothetical protein JDV02_002022 [Purpureocillium takamizusanense]|uniref:Uncharacterized protein n=1 Tax=Purpureocillium takamizusanense TaxID=2060973 RepID=A0A9Q8QA98_9HYPO|nr:uncharacterized protein JDV02_002022 [Purpureocillium takamizusanense]UNI15493.1 hypothetical protein JDV02_002022 [Purpureocillium takamizusanense]
MNVRGGLGERTKLIDERPDNSIAMTNQASVLGPLTIKSLALIRACIGATLAVAPPRLLSLYFLMGNDTASPHSAAAAAVTETHHSSVLLPRLLGVREVALGLLLWTAFRRHADQRRRGVPQATEARRGLRGVLWANLAVDVMDAVSCAAVVAAGMHEKNAAAWFGAGAMVFVVLGALGLLSLDAAGV